MITKEAIPKYIMLNIKGVLLFLAIPLIIGVIFNLILLALEEPIHKWSLRSKTGKRVYKTLLIPYRISEKIDLKAFVKAYIITSAVVIIAGGLGLHRVASQNDVAKMTPEEEKEYLTFQEKTAQGGKEEVEIKPKEEEAKPEEIEEPEEETELEENEEEVEEEETKDYTEEKEAVNRLNSIVIQVVQGKIKEPNIKYYNVNSTLNRYVNENFKETGDILLIKEVAQISNLRQFIVQNYNKEEGITFSTTKDSEEYTKLKDNLSKSSKQSGVITDVKINEDNLYANEEPNTVQGYLKNGNLYITQKELDTKLKEGWFIYENVVFTLNKNYTTNQIGFEERQQDSKYKDISQLKLEVVEENPLKIKVENANSRGTKLNVEYIFNSNNEIDSIKMNNP